MKEGYDMMEKITFCETCRRYEPYYLKTATMEGTLKGKDYEYTGKQAFCSECNDEVYVAEIEDDNLYTTSNYIAHNLLNTSFGTLHLSNWFSTVSTIDFKSGKYLLCKQSRRVNFHALSIGFSSGLYGGKKASSNRLTTLSLHSLCKSA